MNEPFLSSLLSYLLTFNVILFLAEFLFCLPVLKRRRHFLLRLLACFIPYMLPNAIWRDYFTHHFLFVGLYINLNYAALFLLTVFILFFCFDAPLSALFFYCSAGYVVQNLSHNLRELSRLLLFQGAYSTAYYLMGLLIVAAVFLATYLLLVRRYRRNESVNVNNIFLTGFIISTIIVVNLLNLWTTGAGLMNSATSTYAAICCLMLLMLQSGAFQRTRLEREREVTRQLLAMQEKQQTLSRENIELINIKCHDLKHQIAALRTMEDKHEQEKSIREIEKAVMIYDSVVKTGNQALDIVLTEKSLLCESRKINFTCIVDQAKLSFMDAVDIHSLFGNALDNAIEAVARVEDEEKRIISLNVQGRDKLMKICIENYCETPVPLRDGLPATTKEDNGYHGFGLKSIQLIAEKYGGNLTIDQSPGRFSLNILIPET